MYRVHLTTGATVSVADLHADQLRDAMKAQVPQLVQVPGSVNGGSTTSVRINPMQVALLERL
jgi:hypothetical protein